MLKQQELQSQLHDLIELVQSEASDVNAVKSRDEKIHICPVPIWAAKSPGMLDGDVAKCDSAAQEGAVAGCVAVDEADDERETEDEVHEDLIDVAIGVGDGVDEEIVEEGPD